MTLSTQPYYADQYYSLNQYSPPNPKSLSFPGYPSIENTPDPMLLASAPYDDPMEVSTSQTFQQPLYASYPPAYTNSYAPQPKFETHPFKINKAVSITFKLLAGLCFGSAAVLGAGGTFLAGSTTVLLFAVGNPSSLLTGLITLGLTFTTGSCARVALRNFAGMLRDISQVLNS